MGVPPMMDAGFNEPGNSSRAQMKNGPRSLQNAARGFVRWSGASYAPMPSSKLPPAGVMRR